MFRKLFLTYFLLTHVFVLILQNTLSIEGYFLSRHEINNSLTDFLIVLILFITFYFFGNIIANFLKKEFRINKQRKNFITKLNFKVIRLILFFVCIPNTIYFLIRYWFQDINRFEASSFDNLNIYILSVITPMLLGLFLLVSKKNYKIIFYLLLINAFFTLLSGYRSGFVGILLYIILLNTYINFFKFNLKNTLLIGSIIITLVIFGASRNVGTQNEITYLDILQASVLRVSSPELFLIMKNHVDRNDYSFFQTNLKESLTINIPKSLYTNKPLSTSEIISTEVYGNYLYRLGIIRKVYGGVAFGILSEGYYNLGITGVIIYGFLTGLILFLFDSINIMKSRLNFLIVKALFINILFLVESPQLAINAFIQNLTLSSLIFILISKYRRF
jgi:oligosaccharide repeat unit polymerase